MASELDRARVFQANAALEGFDWSDVDDLWTKLDEEIAELQEARTAAEQCAELGDVLFMVVNIARHLDIDPDAALAQAIEKFARRFAYVMAGETLPPLGHPQRLIAMEARWQAAKRMEKSAASRRDSPGGAAL